MHKLLRLMGITVLWIILCLSPLTVLSGGANGPDPIPTIAVAEFLSAGWNEEGAFNWPLFNVACGDSGDDPTPWPTWIYLFDVGEIPTFWEQSWPGWDSLDEASWQTRCVWAAGVFEGEDSVPWPAELPW